MTAHAILSASGSKRWLSCPPSAELEKQFPDETSTFAAEGSFAHTLGELHLAKYLGVINKLQLDTQMSKLSTNRFYSQEMLDYVQAYVDLAIEKINEARARTKDAVVQIEQRLDFSPWVPQGFGTGDLVIIADDTLEIVDLKYGKGVLVEAEGNTQMQLYALGAVHQFGMLYDIQKVRMTIVQPRLNSISSSEMSVDNLINWAENTVKPIAALAIVGKGEFAAGDHCRFCKARFTCRTRAEANLELAKFDFKNPPLLSIEEIAEVLGKAENLQKWVTDVKDFALNQAEKHGVKFPGWKLVEGRSNQKYTDENAVAKTLTTAGYKEEVIYIKSLLGITAMEKNIGKKQFNSLLNELIIKPAGKPTLVPVSDKRPEINSTDSAKADFQ